MLWDLLPLSLEKTLISVPVPELSELPLIPAGNFREITRDPGDAIHILRSTIRARRKKPSACPMAEVTGGKFRREGDLIVLSQLKGLRHKTGEGGFRRFRFPQPEMGQGPCLDQRMEKTLLPHPVDRIEDGGGIQVSRIRVINLSSGEIPFDDSR